MVKSSLLSRAIISLCLMLILVSSGILTISSSSFQRSSSKHIIIISWLTSQWAKEDTTVNAKSNLNIRKLKDWLNIEELCNSIKNINFKESRVILAIIDTGLSLEVWRRIKYDFGDIAAKRIQYVVFFKKIQESGIRKIRINSLDTYENVLNRIKDPILKKAIRDRSDDALLYQYDTTGHGSSLVYLIKALAPWIDLLVIGVGMEEWHNEFGPCVTRIHSKALGLKITSIINIVLEDLINGAPNTYYKISGEKRKPNILSISFTDEDRGKLAKNLKENIKYLWKEMKIPVVAAAGNENKDVKDAVVPADAEYVIDAFGVDKYGKRDPYSNYNSKKKTLGASAPSINIQTVGVSGNSIYASGTSLSAPMVAVCLAYAYTVAKKLLNYMSLIHTLFLEKY